MAKIQLITAFYDSFLLSITSAAITPGIQPRQVKINTIIIEPQPLSITASGGKIIERITRHILIMFSLDFFKFRMNQRLIRHYS